MSIIRIFISSVQVEKSSIYIGLLGNEYGIPDKKGFSPTHAEFMRATELKKHRLIFVRGVDDTARRPQMKALIQEAETQLVRRRFSTAAELISGVYASLIDYLADKELLRFGPFDASLCDDAQYKNLSAAKVKWFLELARASRDFPLKAGTDARTVLLKPHGSYPHNPLIAEPLYLTKYIERMGTGIRDMADRCRAAGLSDPSFKLTDGFVATIYRKPGVAFESVSKASGQMTPPLPEDQVGTRSEYSVSARKISRLSISWLLPGEQTGPSSGTRFSIR